MQSLAKRHDDRIARKAMNRSELVGETAPDIGSAVVLARAAADAAASLPDAAREAFDAAMDGYEGTSTRSLAEAPDGSGETMAGVGVVNTKLVPAGVLANSQEGNGGGGAFKKDAGWGDTAPSTVEAFGSVDAPEGNLNGVALEEQGAGTQTAGTGTDDKPVA